MTDEQFERLMKKLEEIDQQLKRKEWPFPPALPQPAHPWDGLPPSWKIPQVTD